ncbi:MAG: phosphohistidine phosphatase SixA [Candidatus Korobacteraceae bacterium]
MDIYFLRHASANHYDPAKDDDKRPIDKTGEQQCHDVGLALAALDLELDVIISSPLTRGIQTAEIVAAELGYKDKIVTDDALRPEASWSAFQELMTRLGKKKAIMVVGHNPSMTAFLVQMLSGKGSAEFIDFKKGAVAKIEQDGSHSAVLKWCLTPKVARALQKASASSTRPKVVSK